MLKTVHIIIIIIIIIIFLFKSEFVLGEHECPTKWGLFNPNKSTQTNKSNQMLVLRRGENRRSWEKKPPGAETRTNKLSPHMTPGPGIKLGTHWSSGRRAL